MKYGMWTIFVFVITFLSIILLKISFLLFLVVFCPLLIFVLTYASFLYSFRESLQPVAIPSRGYASRVDDLNLKSSTVETMQFRKTHEFYLKTIPDSITYVFKHESEPIYLAIYHLGKKMAFDFITRYENEITLTTANTIDAGMAPRPPKSLLQIFPTQSPMDQHKRHSDSHQFITQKGIKTYDIPEEEFLHYFMKCFREQGDYMRKGFLWPFALVARVITQQGKKYCKSIEAQWREGAIKIFA